VDLPSTVEVSDLFDEEPSGDTTLNSDSPNCEDGGEVKSVILNLVYCDFITDCCLNVPYFEEALSEKLYKDSIFSYGVYLEEEHFELNGDHHDFICQCLNDIVCNSSITVENTVSVNGKILPALPPAPKTLKEAMDINRPDRHNWWLATKKECDVIDNYKVLGIASQSGRGMSSKLLFRSLYTNDYEIKYKTRLVIRGFTQIYGIDYLETYAPTTSVMVIFILFTFAAVMKSILANFDVTAAFLEGQNDYEQYCWLPSELFSNNISKRVRILKSLYGQKQAPKIWYDTLSSILMKIGFVRCPVEPCLFKYISPGGYLLINIHVDDGLTIASSKAVLDSFMVEFECHVKKATLYYPIQKFTGMDVSHDGDSIIVNQSLYISEMKLYPEYEHKESRIPMQSYDILRGEEPNPENESLLPMTGTYRYLADRTRPDILAAVGEVSTGGASKPSNRHVKVSKQIYSYIKSTPTDFMKFGGTKICCPFGFSDASLVTKGNSKGRLGGCTFISEDSGAVHSFSKNSSTVSKSSCIAEIKALDEEIRYIIHIRLLLEFLGYPFKEPSNIYCDNKSAIEIMSTLKTNHEFGYMNVRINYIRECINSRLINLVFVPSEWNIADILTKPLSFESHSRHKDKLMHGFNGLNVSDYLRQASMTSTNKHTDGTFNSNSVHLVEHI